MFTYFMTQTLNATTEERGLENFLKPYPTVLEKFRQDPTTIDFTGAHIDMYSGVRELGRILKHDTSVTTVNLSGNLIHSLGVQELAGDLLDNKTVTTLDLSNNFIDDVATEALINILNISNTTLINIDLSGNRVSDKNIKIINKLLERNRILAAKE